MKWQIDSCFITSRGTIPFCFHSAQRHPTMQDKTAHHSIRYSQVNENLPILSTFHFVNSHFVNSHLVNVYKVGIENW